MCRLSALLLNLHFKEMSDMYWNDREKNTFASAVRNAKRGGYTPPDPATVTELPSDGRCACCCKIPGSDQAEQPGRTWLHLDHDHVTGKFRGWLCSSCNRGIGLLHDSVGVEKALTYLRRNCPRNMFFYSLAEQLAWDVDNYKSLKKLSAMAARNAVRAGYTPLKASTVSPPSEDKCCDCCFKIPKSGRGAKRRLVELYIDSDHITGEFRGWLCNSCNRGIGLLGDSVDDVEKALKYLQRDVPLEVQ
jgi:hypothetical protein